jgi:hypothetical protein
MSLIGIRDAIEAMETYDVSLVLNPISELELGSDYITLDTLTCTLKLN